MANIDRETVLLGFQIQDFLDTGHQNGIIVGARVRNKIIEATTGHYRPPSPEVSRTRSTRSGTTGLSPTWPNDWAHDKALFREAVQTFKHAANITDFGSPSKTPSKASKAPPRRPRTPPSFPVNNMAGDEGSSSGTTPQPAFNEQQITEMTAVINAAIRAALQNLPHNNPQRDPPGNNQQLGTSHNTKEWNADDIGYFDPSYEGTGPVVNVGKSVFYRDIYAFVDRLKDMAPLRGDDKLRTVIPQCLRGTALIWHSTELSENEKEMSRYTNLQGWYVMLIARFKERTPLALSKLQSARYTMADAKDRKDPRAYVQDIMRYAKAANLISVHNQLSMAWNQLDWEFRLHIPEPTEATTTQMFLAALDSKADMWYDMARDRHPRGSTFKDLKDRKVTSKQDRRSGRRSNSTEVSGNSNDVFSGLLNLLAGAQANRPYNKNRVYNNKQSSSSESAKPAPLQITAGKSSDSKKSYSGKAFSKDNTKDKGKGKGKTHAYVTEEDAQEIDYYDPEDKDFEDVEDEDDSETPSEVSEVDANLVLPDIPRHRCRTCKGIFESNNKLHRHIRGGCHVLHTSMKENALPEPLKPKIPKVRTSATPSKTTASAMAFTVSPIIIDSQVDPSRDIGTGFGFRGWKFATADVTLWEETPPGEQNTQKDISKDVPLESPNKRSQSSLAPTPGSSKTSKEGPPESETGCLDTGAGITLSSEAFFARQTRGKVPIRTMASPITVRGIGTDRHSTDRYAIVPINLTGKDRKGNPAIARFRREVHLVEELKANFLVGTDILGPEQISIDLGKKEAHIGSCGVTIPIDIGSRNTTPAVQRVVHLRKTTMIPPHSILSVPIRCLGVPKDRDYIFEPDDVNFSLYAHLVNSETSFIPVRNDTDKSLRIPRNFRLGHITEMDYANACHVEGEEVEDLALQRPKKEHKTSWFKKLLTNNHAEDGAKLPFCVENGLIFRLEGYTSGDHAFEPRRLCIPRKAQKEVFEAVHYSNNHLGFARAYERIVHAYYIRNLSKRLHDYIRHCPQCQNLVTP